MKTLTTKQLLQAAGIESVRTLQRWHERNLVPPPSLQKHPNAPRGMTWVWPAWTVGHIVRIKQRLSAGETLDEIGATLSGDWQAEEKKWVIKRRDIRVGLARAARDRATDEFADALDEAAYGFMRSLGIQRAGRFGERLWKALLKGPLRDEILKLVREGCAPVLLILEGGDVQVVPDFMLGEVLHESRDNKPMIVVPVREALIAAFLTVEPDLPRQPKLAPARNVIEQEGKSKRVRTYRRRGRWSYSLDK